MSVAGRFVGVGVGSYAMHGALKYAVPQVRLVHSWVADVLDGEPLRDPDEGGVRTALKGLPKVGSGGPLLLMWAGHAVPAEVVGLRLLTADSGTEPGDGIAVTDVVTWCSRTGASQVLVVLDACFSAGGAEAAARAASAVMALRPPDADHLWVGVLASCQPAEKALDGEFGRRLVRLLREGPWTADGA